MNKSFMGKKLLSLLLSVLMCLSLIPTVAFATTAEGETVNVAKIGDTEYATLQKAITAATADDTVVLTDNITLSSYPSISKKVTLDLNGKTLSSTAIYTIRLYTNGDLTVKDSSNGEGKICNEYSRSSATTVYLKVNTAKFTLESGTIESNSNIANSYAIRIENKTTGTVNINGGKVIVPLNSGYGIAAGTNAVVNINNGEIIGGGYAVNMTGGSAVINGGTLTSSNDFALHISGSAAVTVGSLDAETIPVINGIKFESNGTDIPDITLVKGKITKVFCMDPKYKYDSFIFTIPDGASLEFGDDSVKPFLPENVTLTENEDGTYSIGASKTYVAKIGDSVYATLKEAFDAVTDDTATTIKLLANCSGDGIQVIGGKNITVDFDGHTYTVDGETVGSAGTKTNGFQLLATSNITFKNGSIVSSKARILIQSYSNLTIENMTLDLSEQPLYGYTLSNNNGVTVINNSTIKAPLAERRMAFDACSFASYGDTTVTLKGNSVIEGDVVFSNESTVNSNVTLNLEGGTIKGELSPGTGAEKVTVKKSEAVSVPAPSGYEWTTVDGVQTLVKLSYVAEVNGVKYETLQAAIDAAKSKATVTLVSNTKENVTIAKQLTLDLNGYTLNGGTVKGKPALTITARVTVKDSSTAQTGTIMREDTAENSGVSSHYVIDVQGGAWVLFEGGNVKNNSGNSEGKGASLVRIGDDSVAKYPGLNIKGGTFTQDNFIAIKVDRGDLFLNGGTINSANSYAIENWFRATVKGGTVNGTVSSWVYSTGAAFSNLEISGGKVNGNVASVNYDDAADKQARIFITGGEITGTLGIYTYNNGLNPITDNTKATIEVTGGTFTNDPTAYLVESSSITVENGKYSVAKAYLAEVDGKQYYTMDEAFKAQTDSGGKDIVLLRDYEKAGTFNSGSIKRTVDLNGHTWTYTGTGINDAAFEINHPNATLTVKNGKVISNSMIGLIPTAMGGTIKYDNSTLIFENVEMISNGHSGIETNGGNSNDTVTLKGCTLNVPNGFGIYFPSSGTLNIENSAITAKTMGVQVCAGSLNISGDSVINVTGDPVEKTENDGAIQDGAAVSVVNRPGYKGLGNVTITGGTFKSAKGEALKAYTWKDMTESNFGENNVISVSGGTFSSAVPAGYCAAGYAPKANNDGTYGVEPKAATGTRKLSVEINGYGTVDYSIIGGVSGTWDNSITNVPYEIGTQFTLKAIPGDGFTFLYWVNSEGRVLTDNLTYNFYLGDNLTIKAVFCKTENSNAYVIFRDRGNTILKATSADSEGYIDVPTNLIDYAGYTFIGWYDADGNKYEEENGRIKVNGNAAITIYAKYKADTETVYTVTVDGIEKGKYTYGSYVTITAEDIEGKEFAGWYINGTLVSYDKAYSFYVTGDVALEARYSDTAVVKEPVITLLVSERKDIADGKQSVILTASWSADSSYTFVGAGIILSQNADTALTLENVDGRNVVKTDTRLTSNEGTYAYTLTLGTTAKLKNVYAVAYFTFIKDGKVVTIYTTVQISEAI